MKSRISSENLFKGSNSDAVNYRDKIASCLATDISGYLTDNGYAATPFYTYCKQNKRKSNNTIYLELGETPISATLKLKDKKVYGVECNPLAEKYSDDVIQTMYYNSFTLTSLMILIGEHLADWCFDLNREVMMPTVVSLGLSKDKLESYIKEYCDLSNAWLGEIALGTMATIFRNREMQALNIRTYCTDVHKFAYYLYVLMRERQGITNFFVGLSLFYLKGRECSNMPLSRALVMAGAGITSLEAYRDEQRAKDLANGTGNVNCFSACLDINPDKPVFPCNKYRRLHHSDIKGRYLLYYQNINTDNTLKTLIENMKKDIPIDQEDYNFFKTVIYAGYMMMSDTLGDDMYGVLDNLSTLTAVSTSMTEHKIKADDNKSTVDRLTQENTVLKRSLDKLRIRYNQLEKDNKVLQAQNNSLKTAQNTVMQAQGIIAVDKQKTAQLQQLQSKLAKSKSRIESLEQQAGDTSALEFELERLKSELRNEKALNAELLREASDLESDKGTQKEQLTQEERDLLAKARIAMILPDFPSLKELKRLMPNSTFTFIPNDRSVVLTPSIAADFCLFSTKMTSHAYFYKLKQMFKNAPEKLILAHTIGNLAICRIALSTCYELGIDKLDR